MTRPVHTILLALFCVITSVASAQNYPTGARSAAMGSASTALSDVWSNYNNQAGLAWLEHIEAGIFYENRFVLSELSRYGLAVAIPVRKAGVFGFNFTRFGYSQWNENKIGVNYSRAFGKYFSLGIQINMHYFQLGDIYGNKFTASGEISFQVKPTAKWIIAGHVYNPTRTPLADYNREKIPTLFRFGSSYQFHDKVIASIELEADLGFKPTFRAGVEYRIVKPFFVRIGFNSNPISPTFGVGTKIKNFSLDAAAAWQPVIGFSPQINLQYAFGQIKSKKTTAE